jgi:hypothetical protein
VTAARVSRVAVELLTQDPNPPIRLSRLVVEALQAIDNDVPPIPDPPANLAADALGSSSIRLTWDDITDETGYRIYRTEADPS